MKNILSVSYSFESGGSERLAASVTAYLHQQGEKVYFCATHSDDGPLKTEMEGLGIPSYGMGLPQANTNLLYRLVHPAIRFIKAYRLLKTLQIDMLYIQHFPMLDIFYLPARILGIKNIIVTEHTHHDISINKKLKRKTKKYAGNVSLTTVVHSKLLAFFKEDLACKNDNFITIENGVDINKFTPKEKDAKFIKSLKVSGNELLLACVARLHPDKDHENLLQAMHHISKPLQEKNIPWRLVLIGGGDCEKKLKQMAADLDLDDRIIFLGDRSDVQHIISNFDLFILPSKTEGLPIVLLEAMACEIPCIATDVGGIAELFTDGGGTVVPPQDYQALSNAILNMLLLERKELAAIGKTGRDIILDKYTIDNMHQRYYKAIVNA